eukprot:XP_014028092.1 PREDICTED: uncharacterized protein LOC106585892 isoform X2 [Salmo salar]
MKEQYLKDKQEKWLEQMNLEADEQIQKFSTQYITRCLTTQHSHDYNQGQELPGWDIGQQVSQELTCWIWRWPAGVVKEATGREPAGGGGAESQQLEAPEEAEPTSKKKKKPGIWKMPLTQFGSPQCQGVHPPLKLVHPAGPLLSLAPHLLGHLEVGRH